MPVVGLSSLAAVSDEHKDHLLNVDTKAFSGATVFCGNAKVVLVNDGHTPERQANTIAHEVAHVILDHAPGPAFDTWGRTLTKEHEDEADWLAACLLVPGAAAQTTLRLYGGDIAVTAAHYGVSVELMRWRDNATKWRAARVSGRRAA